VLDAKILPEIGRRLTVNSYRGLADADPWKCLNPRFGSGETSGRVPLSKGPYEIASNDTCVGVSENEQFR
jgi:hypothetical protein